MNDPTRYDYEMDVTVLVDTTRGYYPEQPITIGGTFDWVGPFDRDAAQEHMLARALDTFDRDTPGYTRNQLLYQADNKRWSLITGGTVTRFDVKQASA
jgi:hypothetical protein